MTRTMLVRTSDGATKAYTYVSTRPNWALRIALLIGLVLGVALVVLVLLPLTLAMILLLFVIEIARRLRRAGRRLLERGGYIATREGRRNVRVVDR